MTFSERIPTKDETRVTAARGADFPLRHGAEPSGDSYSSPAVAFPRCARPPQASIQSPRADCAFATPDGGKGMPPLLIRAAGSFCCFLPCPPFRRVSTRRPSREAPSRRVARPRKPSRIREPRQSPASAMVNLPVAADTPLPPPVCPFPAGGGDFFAPSRKLYYKLDEIFLISPRYKNKNKSN